MFKQITGDITKFVGDVIFNSLGVESDNFGGICESIVNASESKELKEQLLKVRNIYKLGEHFVTKGYALKADNIVHIVMPYYDNDKNLTLYTKALEMALGTCSKLGFTTIGIPLLGSGGNKYPDDLAKATIEKCVKRYLLKEGNKGHKPEITIVLAEKNIILDNRARLNRARNKDGDYHSDKTLKQFSKESKEFKKSADIVENKSFIPNSLRNIFTLDDYISEIINDPHYWKNRINRYLGFGSKTNKMAIKYGSNKYSEMARESTITKDFAFKIVFALMMNMEEATCFLKFFGYTFANEQLEHRDNVIRDLLNKEIYDPINVNNALVEKGYPPLFAK